MSTARFKPFSLPVEMADYLIAHNTPPSEHLRSLVDIAAGMNEGGMRLGTEAGTLLSIVAKVTQPSFAVEVGTFIGYSSLCIASALTGDARLLCCDVSEEWTAVARRHWEAAGVAERIDLVIAPAVDTLRSLADQPQIDLAFVDAEKGEYVDYYEEIVSRLSPTGLMIADNTMANGRVLDETDTGMGAALRTFNDHVAADPRTTNVTVPIGDGLTFISLA